MAMRTPRRAALAYERALARHADGNVPASRQGYAVTGVRFASGHALELRRTTNERGLSVWHKLPAGEWRVHFGNDDDVRVSWSNPWSLTVHVRSARIAWAVHLHATPATRVLNALLGWPLVGIAALRLVALRASGLTYAPGLRWLWLVDASTAWIDGRHAGPMVMARSAERVGGCAIPRRGYFIFGKVRGTLLHSDAP